MYALTIIGVVMMLAAVVVVAEAAATLADHLWDRWSHRGRR